MSGTPDTATVLAQASVVQASLRALRTALADLTFAPENIRRVGLECETLSGALGRLDRMLAASPRPQKSEPAVSADTFSLHEVREMLARMRRLQDPDGLCPDCGGVRL